MNLRGCEIRFVRCRTDGRGKEPYNLYSWWERNKGDFISACWKFCFWVGLDHTTIKIANAGIFMYELANQLWFPGLGRCQLTKLDSEASKARPSFPTSTTFHLIDSGSTSASPYCWDVDASDLVRLYVSRFQVGSLDPWVSISPFLILSPVLLMWIWWLSYC